MSVVKHSFDMPQAVVDRILGRIEFDPFGGCWLWPGAWTGKPDKPYGKIGVTNPVRTLGTHRIMYASVYGDPGPDFVIDHKCRVTLCCNPAHLEPVTHRENLARGEKFPGNVTHCPAGHLFDEQNTYLTPAGYRNCRLCRREQAKLYGRRNKEKGYARLKAWRARKRAEK